MDEGVIKADPIRDHVAAISCGVLQDTPVLDLDYEEDSNAEADANFVLTGAGDIVEIQATGEKRGFTRAEFEALFALAQGGIAELIDAAEGGGALSGYPGDGATGCALGDADRPHPPGAVRRQRADAKKARNRIQVAG